MLQLGLPVVLASASPRRRELLRGLVEEFEVVVSDVDEDALIIDDPWKTAERIARAKARAVFQVRPDALVMGGDTVVSLEGPGNAYVQLAKPQSEQEAADMLRLLSGRRHAVITGVCILFPGGESLFSETTHVQFREMSDQEIVSYVGTGEPMDKAGAYAIQGGAKGFVESVEGSLSNVIGLPMESLKVELLRAMRQIQRL